MSALQPNCLVSHFTVDVDTLPRLAEVSLRALAAQASTLDERLFGKWEVPPAQSCESLIELRLNAWRRIVAMGDENRFARRLAWDGLCPDQLPLALGKVCLPDSEPLPAWCALVSQFVAAAKAFAPVRPHFERQEAAEPIPFAPLLEPLLAVGRAHLDRRLGARRVELQAALAPAAREALERGLLERLHFIGARVLLYEFEQFRDGRASRTGCFAAFIDALLGDGLSALLWEYAALARLWAIAVEQWGAATAELLSRLAADRELLSRTFGLHPSFRVDWATPLLSDAHHGGRFVIALGLSGGGGIVYKPRGLALEAAFSRLLAWYNEQDPTADLRAPVTLDCGTHGWAERIEPRPCPDLHGVRRYYRRAGSLLGLGHLLDVTDLHWENLIAAGEHPVLIDLETLLCPIARPLVEPQGSAAQVEANQLLGRSVLWTGMLPQWRNIEGADGRYDDSGLGGTDLTSIRTPQRQWFHVNTDEMKWEIIKLPLPSHKNRLMLDGVAADPREHLALIDQGFTHAYRLLIEHRAELLAPSGLLRALADGVSRFVFRPTMAYVGEQRHALDPELLREGVDRGIALEALGRIYCAAEVRPRLWPLFAVERRALEQLDVPHFSARTTRNELLAGDLTIAEPFTAASFAAMQAKLAAADERQLALQRRLLVASLTSPFGPVGQFEPGNTPAPQPISSSLLVAHAVRIARQLAQDAIHGDDGSATWLVTRPVHTELRYKVDPAGLALGDGAAGILLFLSALASLAPPEAQFAELRAGVVEHLRRELAGGRTLRRIMPLGALHGRSAIAYALTRAALLLDEKSLLDDAVRLAATISLTEIAGDRNLDVAGGSAGAILALLPLLAVTGDPHARALVIACGEHLLAHRVPGPSGHRAWPTVGGRLITGMSHGAAGITLALARAAAVTERPEFLAAAAEGLAYESSMFDPQTGCWPDLRPNAVAPFQGAWCAGAPGIALARAALRGHLDSPAVQHDLETALAVTLSAQGPFDHLCCGGLGRVDVLIEVGRLTDRPELMLAAGRILDGILRRAEARGGFAVVAGPLATIANPDLFQGLVGIGYALLRAAAPSRIPSVLSFS